MPSDLKQFLLALNRAQGVGPRTVMELYAKYHAAQSIQDAFRSNTLPRKLQDAISKSIHTDWSKPLYNLGINFVCYGEESYPYYLSQIPDAPGVLFYKGSLLPTTFSRSVSIVGTRMATQWGKRFTSNMVQEMSVANLTVVSGMALGIDAQAHLAALECGLPTVAVLADSVDSPSPSRNRYIYEQILSAGGAVVSEAYPGDKLVPGMFASRNRIVAGLSLGTVVVEADIKSGALITAELALGYGRELFAVPGEPGRQMSRGCNELIRRGKARLAETAADILQELGFDTDVRSATHTNTAEKIAKIDRSARIIYEYLKTNACFVEQICHSTGLNLETIIANLSVLQIEGLVIQTEIGEYKAL